MKAKTTKSFGRESSFDSADLILIPAPWEVTASYGKGTGLGPEWIRKASSQLDFFHPDFGCAYNDKIHFQASDPLIESLNKKAVAWAKVIQDKEEAGGEIRPKDKVLIEKVNEASRKLISLLEEKALAVLHQGKIPALVGGEHSVSEALISVMGKTYKGDYGILHIDAHADLRESYQGFHHSHASVMNNVLNLSLPPKKLVQVGLRDLCEAEHQKIKEDQRISAYFDSSLSSRLFSGENWASICQQIIGDLPSYIYVSLDVDGLSWPYAPGTGTPVPGGLSFNQLLYLFSEIRKQKKQVIAFDVVETAGADNFLAFSEWNGNVSARLIYYLAGLALSSHKKI